MWLSTEQADPLWAHDTRSEAIHQDVDLCDAQRVAESQQRWHARDGPLATMGGQ
jgi:hypothetical protein